MSCLVVSCFFVLVDLQSAVWTTNTDVSIKFSVNLDDKNMFRLCLFYVAKL